VADHPLKVPPELFTEWLSEALLKHDAKSGTVAAIVADKAAQWAADAQLMKVNDWIRCLEHGPITGIRSELDLCQLDRIGHELYTAMRPDPPSLKQQALKARENVRRFAGDDASWEILDRAIKALPDE
jgi:hypothetical protein